MKYETNNNKDSLIFVDDKNLKIRYWLLRKYSFISKAAKFIFEKKVTIIFHNEFSSGVFRSSKRDKELFNGKLYFEGQIIKEEEFNDFKDLEKGLKIFWQFSKEEETIKKILRRNNDVKI